ncbi:hypothetical protein FLP10_09500 [Agromyces intestinalis]|uniref:Uncharacterized protein n=1 Tax=Agromyces intestinalis TaxID=2592652 RepID=A0A5C1YGG8_9MICO|nr:hypothetical protein [Agromyces intestinalis]QEO14625.1 hypothetical protein FLP10_09500 [Agromyces intestinalis]
MSRRRRIRFLGIAAVAAALVVTAAVAPAQADPAETYLAVPAGRYPIDVDSMPDDSYVFVISRGDGSTSDLRVYDTSDFSEVNLITFGAAASFNPTAVQVSPDGTQVWVSFYTPAEIWVLSAAELIAGATPTPIVRTGIGGFVDLTEDPTGAYIYAATLFNPQYQFRTDDLSADPRTISLPQGSRGVTVTTDGATAYFTQHAPLGTGGGVQAVDVAADGTLSAGVFTQTGDFPWGITYVGAAGRVVNSNSGSPTSVSGFDPPDGPVTTTPVPCGPRLGDASPNGSRAYLACLTGGILATDYTTGDPVGQLVPIGSNVESVSVVGDDTGAPERLYATSGGSDQLLVFTRPTANAGADQTVDEGDDAEFSVVFDDFWQELQWQVSTDDGTTWTDLADATGESITVPGELANSGNLYRVVATSAFFDPVLSEAMLLTVIPTPIPPTTPVPTTPVPTTPVPTTPVPTTTAPAPTPCPAPTPDTTRPPCLAESGVDAPAPGAWTAAGVLLLIGALLALGAARRRQA